MSWKAFNILTLPFLLLLLLSLFVSINNDIIIVNISNIIFTTILNIVIITMTCDFQPADCSTEASQAEPADACAGGDEPGQPSIILGFSLNCRRKALSFFFFSFRRR